VNGAPCEVTDAEQVRWSCIEATQLADNAGGAVAVVCTPSGGAQSVRLDLPLSWADLPEADLLAAIARARSAK
jgi:hypothetical protein